VMPAFSLSIERKDTESLVAYFATLGQRPPEEINPPEPEDAGKEEGEEDEAGGGEAQE